METTKMNWQTNGKAFFCGFKSGRTVTGTVMVGQSPTGQWVSGAKLLGARSCERGYYRLKAAAPLFESRELAEADAFLLAHESVAANFEADTYLAELDKKSPWKNVVAPVLNPVEFESK